jgi:hypothetical protein
MTKTERVGKLRKMGLSYKQISEVTGISPGSAKVHWWIYKNPDKVKLGRQKYYGKNRERIIEDQKKRRREGTASPSIWKPRYNYRRALKLEGIDWRTLNIDWDAFDQEIYEKKNAA